jgi:hypothetical protein
MEFSFFFNGRIRAVSSAKVAVMESGEVGRSAVYRRYSKGSKTLPWGTPALTGVMSPSKMGES